jgi:sugar phosphate isomerase/epimerase
VFIFVNFSFALFTPPSRRLSPVEGLEVQEDLTYIEKPAQILETADRVTQRKTIRMCKVRWSHHSEEEATWEREDDLMAKYPELFAGQP